MPQPSSLVSNVLTTFSDILYFCLQLLNERSRCHSAIGWQAASQRLKRLRSLPSVQTQSSRTTSYPLSELRSIPDPKVELLCGRLEQKPSRKGRPDNPTRSKIQLRSPPHSSRAQRDPRLSRNLLRRLFLQKDTSNRLHYQL